RWIDEDETALTLGADVTRAVLAKEHLTIRDIDLLLCCSGTPHFTTPSMACLLLHALSQGKKDTLIQAYDINAACSGYLYALQIAFDYLQSRPQARILLVTTETLSRKVNRQDLATAPIFADGASATVLYGDAHLDRLRARLYRPIVAARGEDGRSLRVPLEANDGYVAMNGHRVFAEAVRKMILMLNRACAEAGVTLDDLNVIVPHQANQRIIDAIRKKINVPEERVYSNIRYIGNTSSSSIPLCLERLLEERQPGDRLGLCAFGGGFTFGGAILQIV
ncbi:transketolase, partial [candidate division KSB3 bacterium]|nr:transketolase [candidate division KSB3 bacterium]MBD3323280.1 transketolase [candidate division KSB3 bacterium]